MACSNAAATWCSRFSAASPFAVAFSAPGSFRTAFRSGSALTPNSSAMARKVCRYPPTRSRFTSKPAPPALQGKGHFDVPAMQALFQNAADFHLDGDQVQRGFADGDRGNGDSPTSGSV